MSLIDPCAHCARRTFGTGTSYDFQQRELDALRAENAALKERLAHHDEYRVLYQAANLEALEQKARAEKAEAISRAFALFCAGHFGCCPGDFLDIPEGRMDCSNDCPLGGEDARCWHACMEYRAVEGKEAI